MEKYQRIVSNYLVAKDKNNPDLMSKSFTESAQLEMEVNTDDISFPKITYGLNEITNLLVRNFNKKFRDISTFCISDSVAYENGTFLCEWIVVMVEKESGEIKVGYGKYYWYFDTRTTLLADNLKITIDEMVTLTNDLESQLLSWSNELPYPWCNSDMVSQNMPRLVELNWLRNKMA